MLRRQDHYDGGELTSSEEWDTDANTYTTFDETGAQTSQRPLTPEEAAAGEEQEAAQTEMERIAALAAAVTPQLVAKAETALENNQAALAKPDPTPGNDAFLAIASPTNAQTLAQVKALTQQTSALYSQVVALTRQNNTLIRLDLGLYDTTDDT